MNNIGILRTVRSEFGKAIRKKYESGEIQISRHRFLQHEIREDGMANTLDTGCNQGIFVKLKDGNEVYAVWYPKKQCYIAIRKLTPKECFRLQGWSDEDFDKAQFVNSDSQLYKQAGNGVTVNVIEAIAERMVKHDER